MVPVPLQEGGGWLRNTVHGWMMCGYRPVLDRAVRLMCASQPQLPAPQLPGTLS